MVSLSMEQEPMLPIVASEKALLELDNRPLTFVATRPRNGKMEMFKRLLIAVSLMLMGASILKISQNHSHHHNHHQHHRLQAGDGGAVKNYEHHGPHPHGPPHDFPGRHGPGPHMHHGSPLPRPLECFVLKDDKAVHFNMTVRSPVQSVFLDHSLGGASVDIERSFDDSIEKGEDLTRGPPEGPPPHGPHKGPSGPPGRPGPPHRPFPHPHPHGRPSNVQVSVKSLSSDLTQKTNETYVCSLALPCGKKGLGLFHEDITKHNHGHGGKEEHIKEPKEHKPFGPVSVKLTIPAGPFSVSSGMLPPPPPFHHGGPRHHHQHKGPRKGLIRIINFLKGKKPCTKSAKHSIKV